jgi:hypothetical protein
MTAEGVRRMAEQGSIPRECELTGYEVGRRAFRVRPAPATS